MSVLAKVTSLPLALVNRTTGRKSLPPEPPSKRVPELAGLPNTVAGWGLAFLAIKKAVGANNALLGLHLSAWSTGPDVGNGDPTVPLQEEVDAGYWFYSKLGLGTNVDLVHYAMKHRLIE